MADPVKPQDAARKLAQTHFTQAEQRDRLIKQEIEKERAAIAAKTARLRALRLAKEAAEKEEAAKKGLDAPGAKRSARSPKRFKRAPV